VLSDDQFDARTKRGIEYIYNLEFENAEKEFTELIRLRPKQPAGHFFLAMVQWWKILIEGDNEALDDQFYEALDRVIDLCDELLDINENDVNALFFKGGSIGFQGRLRAHREEWLAAANAGRRALPIVQEASALDPNNYDVLLGSGIYNYYAEVVPREYPFVKPLLLFVPAGDKKKGLEQLAAAAEKGKYGGIESTYFLMQIYYRFERDYGRALSLAVSLNTRFPNNMLFHKYLGRCYVSLNNWPMVRQVFSEIARRSADGQRGYDAKAEREARYYLGMGELMERNYESALRHFYRCDELCRSLDTDGPSGFMVMANLKVGNVYDILAKRDLAVMQYEKVLAMREYKDSYSQAEQFLKSPFIH
jgi:tetratricopeptide (TPR) repeat protein